MFDTVAARSNEVATSRAGDDLLPTADVVMNRAFAVPGQPSVVWPWIEQLGKHRAGWYLPARIESLLPAAHRASRVINPQWLNLRVGDVIPDYGGRRATFEVAEIAPPSSLVYTSVRGRTALSWSISLEQDSSPGQTRVFLRLRLAPIRNKWLAHTGGELLDAVSVAAMAAGLRERLEHVERL